MAPTDPAYPKSSGAGNLRCRPYRVSRRRADRGASSWWYRPYLVSRGRLIAAASLALSVLPRSLFLSRDFPRLADSNLMPHSFSRREKLCFSVIPMNPVTRIHTKKEITDDTR